MLFFQKSNLKTKDPKNRKKQKLKKGEAEVYNRESSALCVSISKKFVYLALHIGKLRSKISREN